MMLFVALLTLVAATPAAHAKRSIMELSLFERAVLIIKKFETLHKPKHWPYVGYGHCVQPGDPYRRGCQLTERQADALLRKDLRKFVSLYKHMGEKNAILLGTLAYNIGPGAVNKSSVGHKKDFISWDELVLAIKNAVNKLRTLPIIILTACNGISIKNTINQLDEPICSKLYAGDGIMLNGPVMGGFSRLLNESGLEFGEKELETLNEELAKRDNPPFICIDYKP